jgi:hypothetical protein
MMDVRDNPHLIGQIALEEGFITADQLQRCMALQAKETPSRPLGRILLETGCISDDRLADVVRIQATRFEQLAADPSRGGLFGQLALRLGYLTAAQLHDGLREQQASGRGGSSLLLGQVLLKNKTLTTDQFLDLLRRQEKEVVCCPVCQAFYDLTGRASAGPFLCTACQTVVHPRPSAHAS